ncbi:hypothetical protein G6F56_012123 [Rhizopus delemar]|nr:hypothetical protein G6F56_012123 [Rhizopus delemar]
MPFASFEERCNFYLARRLGAVTGANIATPLGSFNYRDDPMDIDVPGEMGDSFEDDPMDIDDPYVGESFEDDPMDVDPPVFAVPYVARTYRPARSGSNGHRPRFRRI